MGRSEPQASSNYRFLSSYLGFLSLTRCQIFFVFGQQDHVDIKEMRIFN